MGIALICTGTELLRGSTVNTNGAYLGRVLLERGIEIDYESVVGDREADFYRALSASVKVADNIVICGGLGPTTDDITLACTCRFFGMELAESPELHEKVLAFWNRIYQGHCPKRQFQQALVPVGGGYIPNPVGSASGIRFACEYAGVERHVFILPGPPSEFVPMVDSYLADMLSECEGRRTTTMAFLCAGIGESTVSDIVERTLAGARVDIAYTASFEGTKLFLTGSRTTVAKSIRAVRREIGGMALPVGETMIAPAVVRLLEKRRLTLAVAESCTGGKAADAVVSVPGASSVFLGGVVSYANEVKSGLLKVSGRVLDKYGAVSEETAAAMAAGVARACKSDCALSFTGVAGPDGGTPEKPVGLVYVGVKVGDRTNVFELRLRGNRESIRVRAVARGFVELYRMLVEK